MPTQPTWSDMLSRDRVRTIAAVNLLLPAWVSLVIVVLIGWQLAKIFWMFMPGSETGAPIVIPAGQTAAITTAANSGSGESIADAHIFGVADAKDDPDKLSDVGPGLVPDSTIRYTLKGTIASEKPEYSIAIITDSNNEEKVYVVGDAITQGVSLHLVESLRVVLNERGTFTQLVLPQEYSDRPVASTGRRSVPVRQTNSNPNSIQSVVAQNVSRLADVIRPVPYLQNGQPQGIRVYPGRDRQKFQALGLRPGDLIKEINGQALTDANRAMEIFQELGNASSVSVTVERNGNAETLTLNTSQLNLSEDKTQ